MLDVQLLENGALNSLPPFSFFDAWETVTSNGLRRDGLHTFATIDIKES